MPNNFETFSDWQFVFANKSILAFKCPYLQGIEVKIENLLISFLQSIKTMDLLSHSLIVALNAY